VRLTEKEIEDVVNGLQGTCMSMEAAVLMYTDKDLWDIENEMELCQAVDNAIFLCRECGWWYENGYWNPEGYEDGNGEICLDCMPEENE
jgi:hypothetical protein